MFGKNTLKDDLNTKQKLSLESQPFNIINYNIKFILGGLMVKWGCAM